MKIITAIEEIYETISYILLKKQALNPSTVNNVTCTNKQRKLIEDKNS
jgi:hypothetical protein